MKRFVEYSKCRPVKQISHVYDLTVVSGGGENGCGFAGKKAAKPVTTVEDCVPKFVKVTQLDMFRRYLSDFARL